MIAIKEIMCVTATTSVAILTIFGGIMLNAKINETKANTECTKIRMLLGENGKASSEMYKLEDVTTDDLEEFHPLDERHVYAAKDATAENYGDKDHKIRLSALETLEFAKHGLTKHLKQKIKIIELPGNIKKPKRNKLVIIWGERYRNRVYNCSD